MLKLLLSLFIDREIFNMEFLQDIVEFIGDFVDSNDDGQLNFQDLAEFVDLNDDGELDTQDIVDLLFNFIDYNDDGQLNFQDLMELADLNDDGEFDTVDNRLIKMKLGEYDEYLDETFGVIVKKIIKTAVWQGRHLIP